MESALSAICMKPGLLTSSVKDDEQKAPLGRAVIRGFLLTTVAVLFFVPVVFSMVRHTAFPHMADADFHSDQTELPSATSIRREIQ